jgi:hypothetical protein
VLRAGPLYPAHMVRFTNAHVALAHPCAKPLRTGQGDTEANTHVVRLNIELSVK